MDKSLEICIADILRDIGVPVHILGYRYLDYAIELVVIDPDIAKSVTKVLYPVVAKRFGTTASRVDRAIRHAIEVAFDRCEPDVLYKHFGNTISGLRGKPTNKEFIVTIAEHIRLNRDLV